MFLLMGLSQMFFYYFYCGRFVTYSYYLLSPICMNLEQLFLK